MPFSVPQLSPYHALDRKRKIKNTHPPPHHRTGIGMGHFRRLGYGFIFKWKDKILIVQHQQFNITTSTMGISCTTPALPLELHHYNISTRWILSTQSHSTPWEVLTWPRTQQEPKLHSSRPFIFHCFLPSILCLHHSPCGIVYYQ